MIPVLNYNVQHYINNPSDLVDELIDILGEDCRDRNSVIGLRGGYEEELNEVNLFPSILNIDNEEERELSGTSCIEFVGDWYYAGYGEIVNNWIKGINQVLKMGYGNTSYISIVSGDLDINEDFNDIMEVVLRNAKVECYIKRV